MDCELNLAVLCQFVIITSAMTVDTASFVRIFLFLSAVLYVQLELYVTI
jgi:hypothetical protein